MENHDFKIKKIRDLNNEVKDFHPLLKDLLPKLPAVISVFYTHGEHEMGADFIVKLRDATLDSEEYAGLIVKCKNINQDHTDIERQIDECSIARRIDGGKKNIFLNQIWVVTNGRISENAKIKIHEKYNNKNIKYIWDEKIVELVEKYYPEYWKDIDGNIAIYLSSVNKQIQDLNSKFGIIDFSQKDIYIEQDVAQVRLDARKRFAYSTSNKPEKLTEVLKKERFVLIEAGMGYGKSRLLRQVAFDLTDHHKFSEQRILPVFINFRDLLETHNNSLSHIVDFLKNDKKIDSEKFSLLFMIDAIDEIKGENDFKVKKIAEFIKQLMPYDKMRAVFASRPFNDPVIERDIEKCMSRYQLRPLNMQRLISFIEKLCVNPVVTSRLKSDLQKSDLFRFIRELRT